jgi:hypothetical protein
MRIASLLVIVAVVFAGVSVTRAGQASDRPAVYTSGQAEAGRLALKTNSFGACTDCHTTTLTGRNGDAGELPSVSSLSEDYQKTIKVYGKVPALVGVKAGPFEIRPAADMTDMVRESERRRAKKHKKRMKEQEQYM